MQNDGKTALALADDPTIKSLSSKITATPDDSNALYRRGQVYASKGAYFSPSRISMRRSGSIRRMSRLTTIAAERGR